MAIYAISDLHLSTGTNKSMEVFGPRWSDYIHRIRDNWLSTVKDDDTVLIGGDISWEMKLADCVSDFDFLNNLPGHKIISKGNHDYWWETALKHKKFLSDNGFSKIDFIYNNAYGAENTAVCGTRWWIDPTYDDFKEEDIKIYTHEILRLENSLKEAVKLEKDKMIAVLHYPPFKGDGSLNDDISSLFEKYGVDCCIYGHLHGAGLKNAAEGVINGVSYYLTSADYLNFSPCLITF